MHARSLSALASLLLAPPAIGQIAFFPQCANDCVNNSGQFNCDALDLKCICGLSNGDFLTNILTCFKTNCDANADGLLGPLTVACNLAGHPIPQSAINSAKSAQRGSTATSSAENTNQTSTDQVFVITSTVTATAENADQTAMSVYTITSTISEDSNGSVYLVVAPATVFASTTVMGSTSTISTGTISTVVNNTIAAAATITSATGSTSTVQVTTSTSTSKNNGGGGGGTPFSGALRSGLGGASLLGLAVGLLGGAIWL